jgi:signal transduction histidine kinase/CheY-like chemotaxis protein/HPt (histidine-containing phosphotransfer) domain-containing protein
MNVRSSVSLGQNSLRWPIRLKLALLVSCAVGAGLIVAAMLATWQETSRYAVSKRDSLIATAQVFASAASAAAAENDQLKALLAIRAIGRVSGLVYARIETAEGRTLAELGGGASLDTDARLSDEDVNVWSLLRSRTLQVTVPITNGGVQVGRLVLLSDTADLSERLVSTLQFTAIGMAAALLVGLVVAFRSQRVVTDPIRELYEAMARVRSQHDYAVRITPSTRDEIGALVEGFNAMIGDIRERDLRLERHRERLEQEVADRTADLRVAKDEADAANAAKSDFLATMSHEIRTPMNGMLVMAELLAAADLPERQRRYAEVITTSGRSLLAIINDILDFSKVEAGKLDLESIPVDLAETSIAVAGLFWERARAKSLDLVAYVDPALPAMIEADPVRLSQVLGNLINNALKFTENGGVALRIEPDPDAAARIRFAVTDTGIGIPADRLASIFDAFTQADQSTARRFGGTGLGLAISRRLVEAMGGELSVTSAVGQGSTFYFSLPANASQSSADAWPKVPAVQRALICIGGETSRRALMDYLIASGLSVEVISADRLAESAADLVLADGATLVAGGRRNAEAKSIVALCAPADETEAAIAQRGLADAVLSYPLAASDIRRLLKAFADGQPLTSVTPASVVSADALPQYGAARVLVADDSPVNREVAAAALARFGILPVLVDGGLDAVAAAKAERFDLILMDGEMPDISGFEATARIRADEQSGETRAAIVALTAHVIGTSNAKWIEAGADDVLHKPFTLTALADCLAAHLTATSATQAAPSEAIEAAPEAPKAASQDALLDRSNLDELRQISGDKASEIVGRIARLYAEHAPAGMAGIETAFEAADLSALAKAAHGLKSMSLNIGARRVGATCAMIETVARAENGVDRQVIDALRDDLAATLRELNEYVASSPVQSVPGEQASAA